MDDLALARALHVVAIVGWIGGVAFVTLAAMPAIAADYPPGERLARFHSFERRFVWQARFWVLLAGATGFWMTERFGLWDRFLDPRFWWMGAMLVVWTLFAAMLFVIEPFGLHRRMAGPDPDGALFTRMVRMHRLLLTAAMVTVLGAAGGAHGLF